ncbi:GNAT family N-acetyltransferase [Muriicola soli]|uniref:N-acetyltransferase n=1 Tax=Muriicola soli TaxID=2507538 RepID=A0A411EBD4_9FLAO|nr:GNAT family N-acetyltransferase [Muriicola soli]QBA64958.1 N-acetyltransferase [Muriicola soli]
MKPTPILETDRLVLRELCPDDAEDMLRLHSHPEVQRYTGEAVITTGAGIREKIEEKMHDYITYGYGRWATVLKDGNQFIGWSGLAYLPEFDEIDVGYRFLPQFWGKGLATEATRAILGYAFSDLELERIVAIAMKENRASIRVMEKAGMHFDKYAPYFPDMEELVWYTCERDNY